MEFKDYIEIDQVLNDGAHAIIERNIDPADIQELSEILNEWNPLRTIGGMGGAMLGSALGPGGTIGGAVLGSTLGGKAGSWIADKVGFKRTAQVTPAIQQAKQAFSNLVNALAVKQGNPSAEALMQQSKQVLQTIQGMEQMAPQVDQEIKAGVKPNWFGRARDKMGAWADKHPHLARGLDMGLNIGGAYALGGAMGHHGAGNDTHAPAAHHPGGIESQDAHSAAIGGHGTPDHGGTTAHHGSYRDENGVYHSNNAALERMHRRHDQFVKDMDDLKAHNAPDSVHVGPGHYNASYSGTKRFGQWVPKPPPPTAAFKLDSLMKSVKY